MIAGLLRLKDNMKLVDTIRLATAISAASALREETGHFVKEDGKIYDKVK